MNLKEAYSVLGIPESATQEEAKKKYRELTKKYHPDINKDPGSEDNFKKINEAYHCVQTGKGTDPEQNPFVNNNPFNTDPFSFFRRSQRRVRVQEDINIYTTISFRDSVFGCKKDITFNRNNKCEHCEGSGTITMNNGCTECNGKGNVVSNKGNVIFSRTCSKCMGRKKTKQCDKCSDGIVNTETSISVSIPGGIIDGNVLRLSGMGNYVTDDVFSTSMFTDVFLHISVDKESGLSIEGNNVVSKLNISLLEALTGCAKSVKTVTGYTNVTVPPLSRHNDNIIIPKLGVARKGNHNVVLSVDYPSDVSKIIDMLKEQNNGD